MSFETPENLLCAKSHEYIYDDGSIYVVGITDHAVDQLGDIVFVELPEVGSSFEAGEVFASVESVKAASEVYAPVALEVVEINDALITNPEFVNADPYVEGWFVKVEVKKPAELDSLMEYQDYKLDIN